MLHANVRVVARVCERERDAFYVDMFSTTIDKEGKTVLGEIMNSINS
jgi:hypothetical protein